MFRPILARGRILSAGMYKVMPDLHLTIEDMIAEAGQASKSVKKLAS